MKRTLSVVGLAALVVAGVLVWQRWMGTPVAPPAAPPIELRGPADSLALAATGDIVMGRGFPAAGTDPGFDEVAALLQGVSLAVADVEQPLVDELGKVPPSAAAPAKWPAGGASLVRDLRRIGFTVVSMANDHAADEGADGLEQAGRLLAGAGLLRAGAGADLNTARPAVMIGAAPRRVAVLAVTTSALPSARATRSRGEIRGRAGVSVLQYSAVVTADPATFATLSQMAAATGQSSQSSGELNMSGTVIRRGPATSVALVANRQDADEILGEIRTARANADVVVVSLHTHEPGNRSEAPADFVRAFAHEAIEAGASLVVGHGPRQLRGIEIYRGGVIFYSLGSFAFDRSAVAPTAADIFDTDVNLYELAIDALQDRRRPELPAYTEPIWWQSVVATARFDGARLASVVLRPIDLGQTLPDRDRGVPRVARDDAGRAILQRLATLSDAFGTRLSIDQATGTLVIPSP